MGEKEPTKFFRKNNDNDVLFRRADKFHQMLMEDFHFMEAARLFSGEYEAATLTTDDLMPKEKFRELIVTAPYSLINFATYSSKPQVEEQQQQKTIYKADIRTLRFQTKMATFPPVDIWAHWLLNTGVFQFLMVVVIIVNSILIAWDQELGLADEYRGTRRTLESIDFFFLCLFVSEIFLKWMDGFHMFWTDGWNIFDFLCTTTSLIPPILDVLYPGEGRQNEELEGQGILSAARYLRIIRIFRSLNVVTRLHKIQIIWEAVLKTFRELISITCLMAIFFYIYAIIGINTFDRFTLSHEPNLPYRDAFESIPKAIVHLFLVFCIDGYEAFLLSLVKVMGYWIPCFYLLTWILLAGFIFQNIFTGVMVNNFQNIRETLIEESSDVQQHRRLAENLSFEDAEDEEHERSDHHIAWEKDLFQNLEIINALGDRLTPSIWPRDTLFQYYVLLEALASSMDERNYILKQLDQALVRHMDP